MRPAASRLEAEMTSDIGVEHVVEQPFLFHCSCGATIETTEKREICPDCGETIEVVRCVPTSNGKKYTLRIRKHRPDTNTEPLLWSPILQPKAIAQPTRRHHEEPDHEKRFLRLGLLILLFATFSIIGYFVPGETYQEWKALANTPKPSDCDWSVTPLGDKYCHYESSFRHVRDRKGDHVVVTWQRVND
jgi:predicted RNA-binding Zn-ribbon protein involved in translation (DUF1610 family)